MAAGPANRPPQPLAQPATDAQLRLIYENTAEVLFLLAVEGEGEYRWLTVNHAFLRATGLPESAIVGKTVGEVIPEPSRSMVLARYAAAIQRRETIRWEETTEYPAGTKTGAVWITPVIDGSGSVTHLLGGVHDVTDRKTAEGEVRRLNVALEAKVEQRTAELERLNRGLEAFTSMVAHDLRAPLRGLSGFSKALLEDYGEVLDETGRRYAQHIETASEQMAQLLGDLLQLARVTKAEMRLEQVDLSKLAARITDALQKQEPDRRAHFIIEPGVVATADRGLVGRVIENLFDNAWKFTSQRDEALIEFGRVQAASGATFFFVRDNGAGFEPEFSDRLFEPFQRLHTEAEFPGTGVGLDIVRRIVERHGGRAWARGAVGEGATFWFTLDPEPRRSNRP